MDLPTLKSSFIYSAACRQQRWCWRCTVLLDRTTDDVEHLTSLTSEASIMVEVRTLVLVLPRTAATYWETIPWRFLRLPAPLGVVNTKSSWVKVIRWIVTTRARWPWAVSMVCHTIHLWSCSGSYCSQRSLFDKYIILRIVNNEIWKSAFLMIYAKLNCFPLECI